MQKLFFFEIEKKLWNKSVFSRDCQYFSAQLHTDKHSEKSSVAHRTLNHHLNFGLAWLGFGSLCFFFLSEFFLYLVCLLFERVNFFSSSSSLWFTIQLLSRLLRKIKKRNNYAPEVVAMKKMNSAMNESREENKKKRSWTRNKKKYEKKKQQPIRMHIQRVQHTNVQLTRKIMTKQTLIFISIFLMLLIGLIHDLECCLYHWLSARNITQTRHGECNHDTRVTSGIGNGRTQYQCNRWQQKCQISSNRCTRAPCEKGMKMTIAYMRPHCQKRIKSVLKKENPQQFELSMKKNDIFFLSKKK